MNNNSQLKAKVFTTGCNRQFNINAQMDDLNPSDMINRLKTIVDIVEEMINLSVKGANMSLEYSIDGEFSFSYASDTMYTIEQCAEEIYLFLIGCSYMKDTADKFVKEIFNYGE